MKISRLGYCLSRSLAFNFTELREKIERPSPQLRGKITSKDRLPSSTLVSSQLSKGRFRFDFRFDFLLISAMKDTWTCFALALFVFINSLLRLSRSRSQTAQPQGNSALCSRANVERPEPSLRRYVRASLLHPERVGIVNDYLVATESNIDQALDDLPTLRRRLLLENAHSPSAHSQRSEERNQGPPSIEPAVSLSNTCPSAGDTGSNRNTRNQPFLPFPLSLLENFLDIAEDIPQEQNTRIEGDVLGGRSLQYNEVNRQHSLSGLTGATNHVRRQPVTIYPNNVRGRSEVNRNRYTRQTQTEFHNLNTERGLIGQSQNVSVSNAYSQTYLTGTAELSQHGIHLIGFPPVQRPTNDTLSSDTGGIGVPRNEKTKVCTTVRRQKVSKSTSSIAPNHRRHSRSCAPGEGAVKPTKRNRAAAVEKKTELVSTTNVSKAVATLKRKMDQGDSNKATLDNQEASSSHSSTKKLRLKTPTEQPENEHSGTGDQIQDTSKPRSRRRRTFCTNKETNGEKQNV